MLKRVQSLLTITAVGAIASLSLLPRATAQITSEEFQMGRAREACIDQAQQQQLLFNRVVTTIPISNDNGEMLGSDVIMSVSRSGSVYDVRCSYNNASRVAVIESLPNPGQGGSVPAEGLFPGRGLAMGSVFGDERAVEASLSFNRENNFGFSLFVPPGTGAEVTYSGRISQIRRGSSGSSNNFILQGRVQSFTSSDNNLQPINVTGTCEIEVFDSLVISSNCNTRLRNSGTQFEGLIQF